MVKLTPKQHAEREANKNPALAKLQRECLHPEDERIHPIIDGYDVEQCEGCMFIFCEEPTNYS